jgi:transcriptional regulator with XRE-family HTH domain
MSFFTKYLELCTKENSSANAVAKKIGIRSSTVTNWKQGGTPQPHTLKKIADYFGVPVSYFSEETPETEKSPAPDRETEDFARYFAMLTPEHQQQIRSAMAELIKEQLQG